jgi:hypothetical protein
VGPVASCGIWYLIPVYVGQNRIDENIVLIMGLLVRKTQFAIGTKMKTADLIIGGFLK